MLFVLAIKGRLKIDLCNHGYIIKLAKCHRNRQKYPLISPNNNTRTERRK